MAKYILFILLFLQFNLIYAEEHKIGALLCLTGDCAEWGENSIKGIELGIKEVNESGGLLGKQLTLEVQNSKTGNNSAVAITGFKKITSNNDISFIIGTTWSASGLAVAPLVAKRKDSLIMTSPSLGIAEFNETEDNLFNLWPHDEYATRALAKFAYDKGFKTAGICTGNDPWVMEQGETFSKAFTKFGGKVIETVEIDPGGVTDVKSQALRIKTKNPDFIFYSCWYTKAQLSKELERLGYKGKQIAILIDKTKLKEAQGALENTFFTRYKAPNETFKQKFLKEYKEEPGLSADTAYDALMIYVKAVKKAKTFDSKVVKSTMFSLNYEGASGKLVFDKTGGVKKTPEIWHVLNDDFQFYRNS